MPRGYPNKTNRGWGDMTAEERSQEMRRRLDVGRARKRRAGTADVTADAPTTFDGTLQSLITGLEQHLVEGDEMLRRLKQLLG